MSQDFRDVHELHDFVSDLVHDIFSRLDEPRISDQLSCRMVKGSGYPAFSFGLDTVAIYEQDGIEFVPSARMRSVVVSECVEAARRARRERAIGYPGNRVIGLLSTKERNPLWSCHADLLVVAAFLARGYADTQIHLLGPGTAEPDRKTDSTARNIHPHTIVDPYEAIGEGPFHSHYVRDGYVYAHVSLGVEGQPARTGAYGPLEIISDHRTALSIHGYELPDTVLTGLCGQPLQALLTHPVTDQVPGLRILQASSSQGNVSSIFATLERRRMFLAKPPAGADLSFVELGNDLLVESGQTPVTVLPYAHDLHLARP